MFSDKKEQAQKYSFDSDFSDDGKIVSVLNFLEKYLPQFPEKYRMSADDDEWIINQELFSFLLFYIRDYAFQLIPEYIGKNKSKPDFGVRERGAFYDQQAKHFFDIECKRLFDENKSKQYVSGKTGGIQRFKENKHGVDLSHSAMIGYIEIEDFDFWYDKVNSWISNKNEHLKVLDIKDIAKLTSLHHRKNSQNTSITLTHFWLKMNFGNN